MISGETALSLVSAARSELLRLRVVGGAHRRTERRRRGALLALALGLRLWPAAEAVAAEPAFFPGFPRYTDDAATFADVDGDGDLDLLLSDRNLYFFENTGARSQTSFAAPTENPFGLTNMGVRTATALVDIDADGDLDFFVPRGAGGFYFAENTGSASLPAFASPELNAFALGESGTGELTFGDLDADGDLDALVGTGEEMRFYENTGNASTPAFASSTPSAFGLGSVAFRAIPRLVDLDADGDLDALVGQQRTRGLAFFENTGTSRAPAFATKILDPFGLPPTLYSFHLAVVDIEGDGDFDVVLYDEDQDRSVLVENSGTVASPSFGRLSPERGPFGLPNFFYESVLRFADIDGDGDFEAFIGEYEGFTWQLHNGGSPTNPRLGAGNPFGIGAFDTRSAGRGDLVDIDADGDLDVFVGGDDPGRPRFFENTGSSSEPKFARAVFEPFGLTAVHYSAPTFADIDGDGDFDAFFSQRDFFLNTGTPSAPAFVESALLKPAPASHRSTVAQRFVDIDADGDLDMVSIHGDLDFSENVGTATSAVFVASDSFGLQVDDAHGADFADLDGDGDLDALVGDEYGTTWFAENTGSTTTPSFATALPDPFGITKFPYYSTPSLGDIDGDGDIDAFIATKYGFFAFFENTGTSTSPAFTPGVHATHLVPRGTYDSYPRSYTGPSFADIDGDGDLDALVGDGYNDTLLFENTGSRTLPAFGPQQPNPFGLERAPTYSWVRPDFADTDGDGDLDAFLGDGYGNLWFAENTGNATAPAFTALSLNPFGLESTHENSAPHLVDLDEDGDLDLFSGDYYGDAVHFENTGTTSAPAFAPPVANPFGLPRIYKKSSPFFVDIDGDGDLDYFSGAYFGEAYFSPNLSSGNAPRVFLEYKVKEADRSRPNGILSSSCHVTLDDPLFDFESGPTAENYRVSLVRSLGLPAKREAQGLTDLEGTRLVGWLIRGAAKGVLPPGSGKFTASRKHAQRENVVVRLLDRWIDDGSGQHTVYLETKKETRLLLPAGHSAAGPAEPPNGPGNAYKCYKVKASTIRGVSGSLQFSGGKERTNLQVLLEDEFGDGQGHPQFGDGRRFDLRNVTELCNPVAISDIDREEQDALGNTRSSTCTAEPRDIGAPETSLLCWRLRSSRLLLEQPWRAQTAPVRISPKQERHRKRTIGTSSAIHLEHALRAPDLVNTSKEDNVCFPVIVTDAGVKK